MSNPETFANAASPDDLAQRVALLRTQLQHHGHLYYVQDAPELPDAEYDRMFCDLQALEAAHPHLRTVDCPRSV